MKWAITDKFHDYLYYATSFTVYSDCNPLSYLLISAKLNATTIRWVGELANYNFTIKYRPGKLSTDCDFLSRYPCENDSEHTEELASDTIGAIAAGCKEKGKFARVSSVSVVGMVREAIDQLDSEEIKLAQEEDEIIKVALPLVRSGRRPDKEERKGMNQKEKALINQLKKLELNAKGVLIRRSDHGVQIVLPEKYKRVVYKELHEKMGHLNAERVLHLIRERFYWPYQSQEVHHYVEKVCQCLKSKKPNREQCAPLVSISLQNRLSWSPSITLN